MGSHTNAKRNHNMNSYELTPCEVTRSSNKVKLHDDLEIAYGLLHTSMRIIIGERKPNDRSYVRSRGCHATDAHASYGKLSNGTSGGASNLFAQEDLELF